MTVKELIEKLKLCPQDLPIFLYYDGAPRLIPDAAFIDEVDIWKDGEIVGKDTPSVVLGEDRDIYNKKHCTFIFKPDRSLE